MAYTPVFTTKERVSHYSGVPVDDIVDFIMEDAEDWVRGELRVIAVDPLTVDMSDANLRMAATYYGVYLLGKEGGGKKWKINMTEHTSSSVGAMSESLNSAQFTRDEKPTTDWYGLAQREFGKFKSNLLDSIKVDTRKWKGVSASTTDVARSPFRTTGNEEYPNSQRLRRDYSGNRRP